MNIRTIHCLTIVAFSLHFTAAAAHAAQVTLEPTKDATIFQSPANNGSGGGNGLFAGTNGMSSPRRALLAFDVAGHLPPNAMIQSVQLKLTLGLFSGATGDRSIGVHRLSADWGEAATQAGLDPNSMASQGQGAAALAGDVTWNSRFNNASPAQPWSTGGGVFADVASATLAVGSTVDAVYIWNSTAALVNDVQGWYQNPTANFGWLLRGDESASATVRGFYSRNVQTTTFHPKLTIDYIVPEPGCLLLAAAACLPLARRRRAASHRLR